MAQAPEVTPLEKDRRTTVALAFAQHVMLAFTKEQENEAMKKLPRDMQVEAFVIGILTGLLSTCIQVTGKQNYDAIVEAVTAYIPDAAQNALDSIEAEEHGRAKPQ